MSRADPAPRRGVALAGLSGLLLALSFPRPGLHPLAFMALTPLLINLPGASGPAALLRGFVCGGVFFAVLLHWIAGVMVAYGGLPWPVAVFFLALLVGYLATFFALFAVALARLGRSFGAPALLAAPVIWVGLEIVRGRLLTGYPWGLLGYSQTPNVWLLQVASLGGIYAVSFLVMAVNVGAALLLGRPSSGMARAAAAVLLLLAAGGHLWGWWAISAWDRLAPGASVPVAAIQGNVSQDRKWQPGAEEQIVGDLVDLTRRAAAAGARIAVWPESSSPFSFRRPLRWSGEGDATPSVVPDPAYVARVTGLARELGMTLIAGTVDYRPTEGRLRAYNSAFVITPAGGLGPSYDKVHLVPFGEYVPLQALLFFVDRMVRGAIAEFAAGTRLDPLPTPDGAAGTLICYEAIFPELVRRIGRRADFLVNITNDAWFGRSAAPEQHLDMAIVRAVENRLYLVRAANTGISAIIDPCGRVLGRTPLMESAVLVRTIGRRAGSTFYARTGDCFAWACAILALLLTAAPRAAFLRRGA